MAVSCLLDGSSVKRASSCDGGLDLQAGGPGCLCRLRQKHRKETQHTPADSFPSSTDIEDISHRLGVSFLSRLFRAMFGFWDLWSMKYPFEQHDSVSQLPSEIIPCDILFVGVSR